MPMSSQLRIRHRLSLASLCTTVLLVVAASVLAAEEPLLIENVSVTVGDPAAPVVYERGALLIEDGVIRRVSPAPIPASELPPGVRTIDGSGLFAVPAFIDACTTAGLAAGPPESRNADRGDDVSEGPPAASREARRAGITPEWRALDGLDVDADELETYRKTGFCALHVVPTSGYLAGQGALVSLSGGAQRDIVIRPTTGLAASFYASTPGYPNSLMGVIAYLRQTFLDAGHYQRWHAQYAENPAGLPRPPTDTALETLLAVQRGELPVVFGAAAENDLLRALRLAGEFRLRLILAVGSDAAKVAAEIAAAKAAVVLLAQYEEEPKLEDGPDADPWRVQEKERADWRREVTTATALATAKVPYAWGTGLEKKPAELITSVQRAVEQGVDANAALRALTLGAAELLGAARTHGSIEPGKAADVVLLDKRFGEKGAKVHYLVADGVLFDYAPRKKPDDEKKAEDGASEKAPEEAAKPKEEKPNAEKPEEEKEPDEKEKKESEAKEPPDPNAPSQLCELDADRRPSVVTGGDVFIKDATVITLGAAGTLERASIRVRKGKIEAVGADVGPNGIETIIDASGWYVSPGIIDCHSHMAIDRGVNESSESVTCEVRIGDVVDKNDVAIYRALAGGVTAAHLLHGSANTIGGQCQLIRLKYGRSREEMLVDFTPQTVKFALGENVKQSNSSRRGQRFPVTRMGVEATLRRAFTAAREYDVSWKEHAARLSRGERSLEPRRDLRLEALLKVLEGDIVVHSHCYRADEILMLLGVAADFGFRIGTLQHVLEGYKVAPEIAHHGAGASTFSDWWAYKIEAFDAIPFNAAVMTRHGVVVSMNSDSNEEVRHLNYEAAKAVRYGGLAEDEALKTVTLNPAKQLRVDSRLGTIEVGKDADLAIWDGHPMSVYARCRYTLIEGEVYFERGGDRANDLARRARVSPRDFLPGEPLRNADGLYAIVGAYVAPIDADPIPDGTVVIARGHIDAVGPTGSVTVPAGATVIRGAGLRVYPGLIDAGSNLGLTEIESVRGTVDLGETGSVQPDLLMATAFNAHSELLPTTRANGITTTALFNSFGLVAGQVGVAHLAGTSTPEAIVRRAAGLQVTTPGRRRGRRGGGPRGGERPEESPEVKALEELFARARRYAPEAGRDPRLEALGPYVRKELPVIFTADSQEAIRQALELAERLDVNAVIRGGSEGWRVAALLAEKEVPVIVGPVHTLPRAEFDPYDAPYANAGRLHAAGVKIAFQSSDASFSRNVPFNAGTAVAFGLPHDAALRALTLGAAEIFGIDARRGSITKGKAADLIVTDGDPLEITTHVLHVFIDGAPVALENRHTRFYRQFKDRERPLGTPGRREF